MNRSAAQLGFPRRVVALYLMFCLGAVVLCACGGMLAVEALLKSQATGDALSQVGRFAAAIEIDLVTTSGQKVQTLVDQARTEGRLAWCAVVGVDGRFTAHTDRSLVGAAMIEPVGSQLRWGTIDGVRYRDAEGRLVNEYRAPLDIERKSAGALVMAVVVPGWRGVAQQLAAYAPIAVVGPLGLIGLGGWWLGRAVLPLSGLEQALSDIARLPIDEPPRCGRVAPVSLASVGWNRVVDRLDELGVADPDAKVESRLREVATAGTGGKSLAALQSLSEGIAVTDAEGRIEFANRAVAALLSVENSLDGAVVDELLASISPEGAGSISGGSPNAEFVTELKLATGASERNLRLSRSPLRGDSQAGHVWSFRDITQQKLAEASRDQFIDTATHELRTPLTNIKAYAETLAMGDMIDIEEQKEFCNTINAEATRLARFVDDLLSISSIEVGSLGVQRSNVDVRRLLDEAADKVRPQMRQRSIAFEVSLSEKLGEAQLDKDKVSGMVVNLLGNAAKYTREGGTVMLAAVRQDDQIQIEVRDTGVGIAEDEIERVFEKFFRSDNPEIRDKVGTGLGLPLAREIARLHRGDLTLTSKLGEGSIFTATLPVQ